MNEPQLFVAHSSCMQIRRWAPPWGQAAERTMVAAVRWLQLNATNTIVLAQTRYSQYRHTLTKTSGLSTNIILCKFPVQFLM